MENVKVLGGQFSYQFLTNKLPAEEYAKAKAQVWMHMVNDGNEPEKWLKANGKGTKVNFNRIRTQEEYDIALIKLSSYLDEINNEFGLDYKVVR